MKKIILLISILMLFIIGCKDFDKHDGKIVKDSNGTIYKLQHSLGDSYFIYEIDTNSIKDIKQFMEE
jgi:hypothetical protein